MGITIWETKSKNKSYRNLHLINCTWWLCTPMNIKFNNFGGGHYGFEFMPIGFNKYNQGWSFRLFALKLVWVG
jgi:hypothetical protein